MIEDVYKRIRVVVSLVDAETDKPIETKEMEVKDGQTATSVEFRVRKLLMSLLVPGEKMDLTPNTAVSKAYSKRVTNAALQKTVEAHEDVIQTLIRVLNSKGLMSEAVMQRLTGTLGK